MCRKNDRPQNHQCRSSDPLAHRFNKAPFQSPTTAPFSPFPPNFRLASPSTPLMFKQAMQEVEHSRKASTARQQLSFAEKIEEAGEG